MAALDVTSPRLEVECVGCGNVTRLSMKGGDIDVCCDGRVDFNVASVDGDTRRDLGLMSASLTAGTKSWTD